MVNPAWSLAALLMATSMADDQSQRKRAQQMEHLREAHMDSLCFLQRVFESCGTVKSISEGQRNSELQQSIIIYIYIYFSRLGKP